MSLVFTSGTQFHASVPADDKATLIGEIEDALTTCGWTVISGAGTSNVKLESIATTAGNQIRVRVWDDSANCVRIRLMNTAETVVMSDSGYLLPAASKDFIINANRHQFTIYCAASDNARDFVMVSALYIPSHLTSLYTTCAFLLSQSATDTDTGNKGSFRVGMSARHPSSRHFGNFFGMVGSTTLEITNNTGTGVVTGTPGLMVPQFADVESQTGVLWHDQSAFILEPLMGWGLSDTTDPARIYGQLWNAAIVTEAYPMDEVPTAFSSHNWINLTSNNSGTSGVVARGSLLLTTP